MRTLFLSDEGGWCFAVLRQRFFPFILHVGWFRSYYILGVSVMRNGKTLLAFSL